MSRTVRTPVAAALAAAVLSGGALAAAAPAAAAGDTTAPRVVTSSISDTSVRLLAVGYEKITIKARVTDNVGATNVEVTLARNGVLEKNPDGSVWVMPLRRVSGTAKDGVWSNWFGIERTDPAGTYKVVLAALDNAENVSAIETVGKFVAKFKTRVVNVDVRPEPAKLGEPVKISGRLDHVTPTGWKPFGNRDVAVEFRAKGTSTWVKKGTLRTGSGGKFSSEKFRARKSGDWRVTFAGGALNAASVSAVDFVKAV